MQYSSIGLTYTLKALIKTETFFDTKHLKIQLDLAEAAATMEPICSEKLNLLSTVIPKSLQEFAKGIVLDEILKEKSGFFPPIVKIEHLLNATESCHSLDHCSNESRPSCSKLKSELWATFTNNFRSSANKKGLHLGSIEDTMSLMKIVKSKGPRTLPCGTPLLTKQGSE